jgi:hypothetical protein
MQAVAESTGARYVVVATLAAVERDYGIALYLFDASGNVERRDETTCEICSHAEAAEALAEQARALRESLAMLIEHPYGDREPASVEDEGPAVVVFESQPPGGLVKIDGKRAGTTPFELELEPGLHDVTVAMRGHAPAQTTVRAMRGERITKTFVLLENRDRQTKVLRGVAWGTAIPGLLMLGAGATLLAFHEHPYEAECSGEDIDVEGRCRYRYNFLAGGATLTAVGVAAIITGLATGLVVFARKREKTPQTDDLDDDTISVRPVLGPTHAGLQVRF